MKKNILFFVFSIIFIILIFIYFTFDINTTETKYIKEGDNSLDFNIKYPYFKYEKGEIYG